MPGFEDSEDYLITTAMASAAEEWKKMKHQKLQQLVKLVFLLRLVLILSKATQIPQIIILQFQ